MDQRYVWCEKEHPLTVKQGGVCMSNTVGVFCYFQNWEFMWSLR